MTSENPQPIPTQRGEKMATVQLRKSRNEHTGRLNRKPGLDVFLSCQYNYCALYADINEFPSNHITHINVATDTGNYEFTTTIGELKQGVEIGSFQHFDIEIEIEDYGVFTGSL